MLILFDHSTPAPLRGFLAEHAVVEALERGWQNLANGDLLNAAEAEGFEVLITADKNIRYQQDLTKRKIAILELGTPQWPVLRQHVDKVISALKRSRPAATSRSPFLEWAEIAGEPDRSCGAAVAASDLLPLGIGIFLIVLILYAMIFSYR